MKCPLSYRLTTDAKSVLMVEAIDCLKEECGAWLEDVNLCPIKAIALELRYIQLRLADLIDKMPDELQFRK